MTIFYADDDAEDQEKFAMVMRSLDPAVKLITARDGKEALVFLSNTPNVFDAIFLDLNMPLMNGLECVRELRTIYRYKHTPIFLYSTTSEKAEIERGISAGADRVFVKSHAHDEIMDQLREAISRWPYIVLYSNRYSGKN